MLTTWTRKLCPLMTLAFATVGCGKKISDPKTPPVTQVENQVIPSTFIIRLDGSLGFMKNFNVPKPAQFLVPDRLKVRKGTTTNKVVEIAYVVNEYDSDDFEFKCSYVASANAYEMILSKCVNYDNEDFGDVSEHKFTLRPTDMFQMRFTGAPANDLIVEAIYSMKWI